MSRIKKRLANRVPTPSGIVIPVGRISESSERSKTNFIQVKGKAEEIEQLFANAAVTMSPGCGLANLIDNAKTLGERWLAKDMEHANMIHVFYALHLQRVADAVLPLVDINDKERYLRKLLAGEVDFFKREISKAKDILWELELWSSLQERGASAILQDPPDIVLSFGSKTLGIACKKIYSEKNVEKVLSEAVGQVEDSYDVGVVAINIDDLTPENTVLKVRTESEMASLLQKQCDEFLQRHERHFRKYLANGRLVAALVSVHVIADVEEWDVAFNNARQSTVWTIPGLPAPKESLVHQFHALLV
jgi:hypothetical protein